MPGPRFDAFHALPGQYEWATVRCAAAPLGLGLHGRAPRPGAACRSRHPCPERSGEDRPRPRQAPARRALRGDRRGRRLRPTGPATRRGRTARRSSSATRSGAASGRRSATAGRRASNAAARTWRSSPATTSTSPPSWQRARPLLAGEADYVQGSRWMPGGRVIGPTGGRGFGTRLYSRRLQRPRLPPGHGRDERVPRLPVGAPARSRDQPGPGLARQLRPGAVRAVQGHPAALSGHRAPVTVRYHAAEGYTKMRGMRDWWRLFRPATPPAIRSEAMIYAPERAFAGRRVLVTGGAGFVGVRSYDASWSRAPASPSSTTCSPGGRDAAHVRPVRPGFRDGRDAGAGPGGDASVVFHMAARNIIASHEEPAGRLRDQHRRHAQRPPGRPRVDGRTGWSTRRPTRSTATRARSRSTRTTARPALAVRREQARRRELLPRLLRELRAPVAVVRYSNVFGHGQRPDNPYCGVVSKFFASAMAGEPLHVHGDGEQTRDFTYVDDAVEATLLAAIHPRAEGEVFNIGTGIETSVNALAAGIGAAVGRRGRDPRTSTAATSTTSAAAS